MYEHEQYIDYNILSLLRYFNIIYCGITLTAFTMGVSNENGPWFISPSFPFYSSDTVRFTYERSIMCAIY